MQWLLLLDCQLFNMPLNTADVSLDATFDNIKSSLDTIVSMGQDLLCLKRETDKLVPIEPAVVSEKAVTAVEALELKNMLRQEADQMDCVLKINCTADRN